MRRSVRAAITVAAATAIGAIGLAGAAQAHVTVSPSDASQGGSARIAFRVPTESDSASTTKLQVYLPTDKPVASVLVMPVPGWTAQVSSTKLASPITTDDGDQVTEAVSRITWNADSAATAIKPGQFQEFPIMLGPLPESTSMTFKVLQTYSDGTIVRWIDESTPGAPEPEHPAPVLNLVKATGDPGQSGSAQQAVSATDTPTPKTASNAAPLTISIIAAVLALAGLIVASMAFRRGRPDA